MPHLMTAQTPLRSRTSSTASIPPRRPTPVGVRLPVPDDWAAAIEDFLLDRLAAGRPATSRRSYRSALEHLARRAEGGPFEQTRMSLKRYINGQPDWSVETRRSRRGTMVAFYDWAVLDELMTSNPARELPKVKAAAPAPRPAPELVYQRALLRATPRQRLMLRLAEECAMRRGEVAQLHTSDITPGRAGGWLVRIHGKGSKDRVVPMPEALALEIRCMPAGYVFPGNRDGHLSAEYVGRQLAAVMPDAYTMHTLRHSFATRAYQDSGDIVLVQEFLGHSNPSTTMRYVLTDNEEKMRALAERLAGPRRLAG